jgi:hypothetical protein
MAKVIETNLIICDGNVKDFQSRIIEVESWEEYVNLFKNYSGKAVGLYLAEQDYYLEGWVLLNDMIIKYLEIDKYHLICNVQKGDISFTKISYLVGEIPNDD